jgi:hypothetical protein
MQKFYKMVWFLQVHYLDFFSISHTHPRASWAAHIMHQEYASLAYIPHIMYKTLSHVLWKLR